jgi:hypothetical protein
MCQFTNVPMVNLEMVGAKNLSPRLGDDTATIEQLECTNGQFGNGRGEKIFAPFG